MKAIEVKSPVKVYGGGTRAVDDITLSVDEGEVFGLLGPNGEGKTTIFGSNAIYPTSIRPRGFNTCQS